jgi:hypothetical protein
MSAAPMTAERRHAINLARYRRRYARHVPEVRRERERYPWVEPVGKRWPLKWLRECFKLGMLR